ncbi:hypothetical protein [Virgibacillus doumboii]|uniref:hypothetical protein n=1 Tax=Virgibacillus doumboii TaxID=2697503 RepID=UPI0013DF81D3|nr:hypothetical protein [Virgibacillus doumboii]
MSIGIYLIMGICSIQVTAIIFYIVYYRKRITDMYGMLISMSTGMAMGILMGTILGVVFQDNLFESTIYAILIGLAIGFITGVPVGLPAVIDGILSGIMGGMMGAMLGDMIAMTRPDEIVKILALIVTMVLLLVLYTTEDIIRKQSGRDTFTIFRYPFLILLIISIIFIGLNGVELFELSY